jgi:hypothetical protein
MTILGYRKRNILLRYGRLEALPLLSRSYWAIPTIPLFKINSKKALRPRSLGLSALENFPPSLVKIGMVGMDGMTKPITTRVLACHTYFAGQTYGVAGGEKSWDI